MSEHPATMLNTRAAPLQLPDGKWAMPGSNFPTKASYWESSAFRKWVKVGIVVPAVDDTPPIALPPRMEGGATPTPKSKAKGPKGPAASPPQATPPAASNPVAPPVKGKWTAQDLENISTMNEDALLEFHGKLMAAADEADAPAIKAVHDRAATLMAPKAP